MSIETDFIQEYHQGNVVKKASLIVVGIVFGIVCAFLQLCAKLFHVTYNTVNVVSYYFLIPLSWTILLDRYLEIHYSVSLVYIGVWIGVAIMTIGRFQKWCDMVFMKSVCFLLLFKRMKWNYHVASVVICVIIPVLVYSVLFYLNITK